MIVSVAANLSFVLMTNYLFARFFAPTLYHTNEREWWGYWAVISAFSCSPFVIGVIGAATVWLRR